MRGTAIPALVIFTLLTIHSARAAELSPEYQQCINSTTTNAGWAECSAQEIARQEQRLGIAWDAAFAEVKKVSAQSGEMLLAEQRAWVKFKDSAYEIYKSGDFGREGQSLDYGACKVAIIIQRIDDLRVITQNK